MKKIDIGVIGAGMYVCGNQASDYGTILPGIFQWEKSNSALKNLFCASTSKNSARRFSNKCRKLSKLLDHKINPKLYPSNQITNTNCYKQMLKEMSDDACVIISVPDHLHFKIALDCLKAKKHVLLVKPFTPTVKEAKVLIKEAESARLHCLIEFHKRWDLSNRILKDEYRQGKFGELLYSLVEYSQRKSIPLDAFNSWASKTSILQYLGVHYIDLMRFITGSIPKRVMATGQKFFLKNNKLDTYDAIQCHIEWQTSKGSMFSQIISTNWIDPETTSAPSDQSIKLIGTNGRIEADQKDRGIMIVNDKKNVEHINPYFSKQYQKQDGTSEWLGYGIDSIKSFLTDILELQNNKTTFESIQKFRPTFSEAIYSTAVIEAAHESLKRNSSWQNVKIS